MLFLVNSCSVALALSIVAAALPLPACMRAAGAPKTAAKGIKIDCNAAKGGGRGMKSSACVLRRNARR